MRKKCHITPQLASPYRPHTARPLSIGPGCGGGSDLEPGSSQKQHASYRPARRDQAARAAVRKGNVMRKWERSGVSVWWGVWVCGCLGVWEGEGLTRTKLSLLLA